MSFFFTSIFNKGRCDDTNPETAINNLIEQFRNADWRQEDRVAAELQRFGQAAVPILFRSLDNDNQKIRVGVIKTLKLIHFGHGFLSRQYIPTLIGLLSDNQTKVAENASLILVDILTGEDVPILINHFEQAHPRGRYHILRLIEYQIEDDPNLHRHFGRIERINHNVSMILCQLVENSEQWSNNQNNRGPEQDAPPISWEASLLSIKSLFLLMASGFCPSLKRVPAQFVQALVNFRPNSNLQYQIDYFPEAQRWLRVNQKYFALDSNIDFEPFSAYAIFDNLFNLIFLKELRRLHSKNDENSQKINRILNHTNRLMKIKVNERRLSGTTGSGFMTYAYASSLIALKRQSRDNTISSVITRLNRVIQEAQSPLHIPYKPILRSDPQYLPNVPSRSVRASAARNVVTHLALFLTDSKRKVLSIHKNNLIAALKAYVNYLPDLIFHTRRDCTHAAGDRLAPYYFYPSVPYATAAVYLLLQHDKITTDDRNKLISFKLQLKYALLTMYSKLGTNNQFCPMGGLRYFQTQYSSSPRYTNPLAGLALIPLLDHKSKHKQWKNPFGILNYSDCMTSIQSNNL